MNKFDAGNEQQPNLLEDLARRDRILEAVAEVGLKLLTSETPDNVIPEVLQCLGVATDVDRLYIFENSIDADTGDLLMTQRYEWTNEHVVAEIDNPELQQLPYRKFTPRWEPVLSAGNAIVGNVADLPEDEQIVLSAQGIQSILVIPVFVSQQFWGFIGFDAVRQKHPWSPGETAALQSAAASLGAALARHKAESEQRNIERQLHHAQKLESLGLMAGGLAHDFNNMLTAVIGHLDLALLDLPADSPVLSNIEEAKRASLGAADLTRQMLAYAGQGANTIRPISINSLIEENITMLNASLPKTAYLMVHSEKTPLMIEGDESQIQQILVNLIVNAAESLENQPGQIWVRYGAGKFSKEDLKRSRVQGPAKAGTYVWIEVRDTGTGIDPSTMNRIFDPFFTTKSTGRGLGMSVILGIVRSYNGHIFIESVKGRGTTMRVLFPEAYASSSPCELEEPQDIDMESLDESINGRRNILVVDDEYSVRWTLTLMLKHLGFTPTVVSSGEDAVRLLRETDAIYDIALIDLSMPGMDGVATTEALRKLRPGLHFLLSSGFEKEKVSNRLSGHQHEVFLQKPYEMVQLQKALKQVLGHISKK